ncbi:hypothetical protein H0H92_009831 [Tricholoma furcatifolium]|nr:hypothetical protein H0H92_009831 [Tricholoma furcatifolium]
MHAPPAEEFEYNLRESRYPAYWGGWDPQDDVSSPNVYTSHHQNYELCPSPPQSQPILVEKNLRKMQSEIALLNAQIEDLHIKNSKLKAELKIKNHDAKKHDLHDNNSVSVLDKQIDESKAYICKLVVLYNPFFEGFTLSLVSR